VLEIKMEQKMTEEERLKANVAGPINSLIPKFCTTTNLALLNSKMVVLTFLFNDHQGDYALIDRIAIDPDHARSLRDNLNAMLDRMEEKDV
jgi:hypothetical protein